MMIQGKGCPSCFDQNNLINPQKLKPSRINRICSNSKPKSTHPLLHKPHSNQIAQLPTKFYPSDVDSHSWNDYIHDELPSIPILPDHHKLIGTVLCPVWLQINRVRKVKPFSRQLLQHLLERTLTHLPSSNSSPTPFRAHWQRIH